MAIPTEYYKVIRRERDIEGSTDFGIVVYYRMNEKSGSTAIDWAGIYNIDGIYNKEPVTNTALIVNDNYAGSKIFNGENLQNLEIPNVSKLSLLDNMTIEAWIIPLAENITGCILGKSNKSEPSTTGISPFMLGLKESKVTFVVGNGSVEKSITESNQLRVGIPVHVVGSLTEQRNIKIFINGELVNETGFGEEIAIKDSGKPLYCGNEFKGAIAEVAAYHKVLNEKQIKNHFNVGRQVIFQKPFYTTYDPPSYS